MSFVSGELLTVTKLEDANEKNAASGYCGLNEYGRINKNNISIQNFFYWNAAWSEAIQTSGTWYQTSGSGGTLCDKDLTGDSSDGYILHSGYSNDTITWKNLKLSSGNYNIRTINYRISSSSTPTHYAYVYYGSSLITYITCDGTTDADNIKNSTFSLTENNVKNLNVQVLLSGNPLLRLSRLEITKV